MSNKQLPEEKWIKATATWNSYPNGTKAKALMGGYWIKTDHGWYWPGGSTFPTPGGDATGEISLPVDQLPADTQDTKWKLILHEQGEDPYYEITNGPISICAPCGFVGETEEQEDAIFKKVADALNESGIDFHSENALELKQHIEIMKLQQENERLNDQNSRLHEKNRKLSGHYTDIKAKGEKMALALRRLARSVSVHPDYGKGQPNEFFDLVDGAHEALAEWSGVKEVKDNEGLEWLYNPHIEFCYRHPDGRVELRYRRIEGTPECEAMIKEVDALIEKAKPEVSPYFYRKEGEKEVKE